MTSFMNNIDIFKQLSGEKNGDLVSKLNMVGLIGSTAMMTYFYKLSVSKDKLEEKYGEDFAPRLANYFRYGVIGAGCMVLYHYLLYPRYPLKDMENSLGIPSKFNLSDKQRYFIASCIAIPAIIIELLGWKEAKWSPIIPSKADKQKQLFGGVYNYIRHPIWFCEYSWFYTLALLMNHPFLLLISGVIMQPSCYLICKYDEKDAIDHLGQEYQDYRKKVGFWFPKTF